MYLIRRSNQVKGKAKNGFLHRYDHRTLDDIKCNRWGKDEAELFSDHLNLLYKSLSRSYQAKFEQVGSK